MRNPSFEDWKTGKQEKRKLDQEDEKLGKEKLLNKKTRVKQWPSSSSTGDPGDRSILNGKSKIENLGGAGAGALGQGRSEQHGGADAPGVGGGVHSSNIVQRDSWGGNISQYLVNKAAQIGRTDSVE